MTKMLNCLGHSEMIVRKSGFYYQQSGAGTKPLHPLREKYFMWILCLGFIDFWLSICVKPSQMWR